MSKKQIQAQIRALEPNQVILPAILALWLAGSLAVAVSFV